MDQKREEADMYLFRHRITQEKDRAKTRWQKVERTKRSEGKQPAPL